jgi:hypothetical protein
MTAKITIICLSTIIASSVFVAVVGTIGAFSFLFGSSTLRLSEMILPG